MASTKDAKLLKQTKFPPEFNKKVDMQKVNVEVMKKWIAGKISDILGNEDDVVIELCFGLLEASRYPDIKDLQIKLTGFLDKDTPKFCKELWNLCLSAQDNPQGVAKELLEAKKLELIQEKIDAEKSAEVTKKLKEEERQRERNVESTRQRERGERGFGRGRGGREPFNDRRPPRYSRSPPLRDLDRRRYSRSPPRRRGSPPPRDDYYRGGPPRRDIDTYVPGGRRDRYDERRRPYSPRRRSLTPSSRSSRSITPPPRRRGSPDLERSERRRRSPPARGDHRTRSYISSEASRSRSPRRSRNPPSRSVSRSPPPRRSRNHHRRRNTSSPSSPSRSITRDDRPKRRGRSPSYSSDSDDDRRDSRADYGKGRNRHHSRDRRHPPKDEESRSRSRSRSKTPEKPRKRHRSLQRYMPAGRRRRNTSSVSSTLERKKQKTAHGADREDLTLGKPRERETEGRLLKEEETPPLSATPTRELTESELKEKALKEKVIAMRRQSMNGVKPAKDSLTGN
ncbi:hypothetical protein MMC10_003365 [Thelotrema lepadinum]|nr:hypothetical protein [Thelotrema lepadinum]